ncbi:SigE family RNA polymerase sigma factor [Acidothermaceae bacterium B102]|nr:SigE family RNA polymerase sigma factor [Acidothermaceae bacterium B102]
MTGGNDFQDFVRARTPALLRTAYLLTGDQQLAEDLVQTALAKTCLAWSRIERSDNADAYVRRVMYHQQVSWWRRRRVAELLTGDPPERATADEVGDRATTRIAVQTALLRLTPSQRAVLVLRYFEDQPESVVAELLGCSLGNVKSQTHKALARLRKVAPELADFQPLPGHAAGPTTGTQP